MKRVKTIVMGAFILALGSANAFAQDVDNAGFKPSGKPLATIFSDFRYNTQDSKSNTAFELTRAYLGYSYKFSPDFSSKVVFDFGNTGSTTGTSISLSQYSVFVKNAFVEYSKSALTVDFGMIGTSAFNLQESLWGKRYLLQSFQDLNGYSSSADLGISAKIKITRGLTFDAQILNGEGYKKLQSDSIVKLAAGLTYEPIEHLYLRVYGDYMKAQKNTAQANQSTLNAFIAYAGDDFTLAGEYNYQKAHGRVADHNLTGLSLWGTYHISKVVSVFGRYDNLSSNTVSGASQNWNRTSATTGADGSLLAAGVELFPVKGVSISPNIQYTNPKLSTAKASTSFLLNVGLNF